jgi:Reverse transcriptase (RNA-dependent DNA polymerase)
VVNRSNVNGYRTPQRVQDQVHRLLLAFVQARLKEPVWIHLPHGHYLEIFSTNREDKCLELEKSLYGLSVAPKLWYIHLQERLAARGFWPSDINPCLYYQNEVGITVYVDDVVMIGRH